MGQAEFKAGNDESRLPVSELAILQRPVIS